MRLQRCLLLQKMPLGEFAKSARTAHAWATFLWHGTPLGGESNGIVRTQGVMIHCRRSASSGVLRCLSVSITATVMFVARVSAQSIQYRSPAGVEYRSQRDTGAIARAE